MERAETSPRLVAHIGLGQGVALYVSAIVGAGVLVLPGQLASMAGPASLLSWLFACAMGVPLALLFAALATRHPDAGGIATYARRAFGPTVGGVSGWLYFAAGSVGQTIVPLTGGYFVADAFGLGDGWSYAIALLVLAAATGANLAGVRVSGAAQLALAATVTTALALTILVSVPRMEPHRLIPFAPHGLPAVGAGVVVLFFAFAGWEAVGHLAGEFRDPGRDLPRAAGATVVVVTVLYLGAATAVVLTGTYGTAGLDHVAIGRLTQDALGGNAAVAAGLIALLISLGTTNAFVAAISRLGHSLATDGWLPRPVTRVSRGGVPVGGVVAVASIAGAGLALARVAGWGTETLIVVPSTLVVAVYLLAGAAGIRLLRGRGRVHAVLTVALTGLVVPTAVGHLVIAIVTLALALLARAVFRPRHRTGRSGIPRSTRPATHETAPAREPDEVGTT